MAENKKANAGRPDLKSRPPKKKSGGGVKAFVTVAILGLVVGLGIVFKDQIIAMLNKKTPAPVAAPPPKPVETAKAQDKEREVAAPLAKPAAPMEKAGAAVVIDAAPKQMRGLEDDAAGALIKQGKALLEKFEFDKAAALFKEAGAKKVGTEAKKEALDWEKKAVAFGTATRHIPTSEYAIAETTYVIETRDGREMQGLIISQNNDQIELQQVSAQNPASLGKTKLPIPKSDIAKTIPIPLKARQDDFLQILGGLESNANIQRSADYYDLVYISKRLGLGRECLEYLKRAYNGGNGHPADPYLGDSFRKEVIRRTIDRCSLMLASGQAKYRVEAELNDLVKKKLPGYQVAQEEADVFRLQVLSKMRDDFKSTLKEVKKPAVVAAAKKTPADKTETARQITNEGEQMEFVVDNGGVTGKGAAAPVVDKANAKYDEGMKVYRSFRQGTNGNNNQFLKEAMKHLTEAVDLYDQALKTDPSNKAVLDRQTEANMIVYACKKYQTL
jgi:hypothetical protein